MRVEVEVWAWEDTGRVFCRLQAGNGILQPLQVLRLKDWADELHASWLSPCCNARLVRYVSTTVTCDDCHQAHHLPPTHNTTLELFRREAEVLLRDGFGMEALSAGLAASALVETLRGLEQHKAGPVPRMVGVWP